MRTTAILSKKLCSKTAIVDFNYQWDKKLSFKQNRTVLRALQDAILHWLISAQPETASEREYKVVSAWESKSRPVCHFLIQQGVLTMVEVKFNKETAKKLYPSPTQIMVEEKKARTWERSPPPHYHPLPKPFYTTLDPIPEEKNEEEEKIKSFSPS